MSDLISRSALIEDLKECLDEENIQHTLEYFGVYDIIRSQPTVEAKPVVHCKDCIWWEDEHILLSDGTKRPYTEEEKKNCPIGVACDIGINVGSRCMVNPHITTLFRNADDYCSRADMRKKVE